MATTQSELEELYERLNGSSSSGEAHEPELSKPKNEYDNEAHNIYKQSHRHRNVLIEFYISYTIWFSAIVAALICTQAFVRIFFNGTFEIMPQWTLNLVITGMFVQFIGLLKIVTTNVWDLKSLLNHHSSMQPGSEKPPVDAASI